KGGKQTPYQGTVRVVRIGSLQAVIPKAVANVCWTTSSGLCDSGNHDGSTSFRAKKPPTTANPYHGLWPFYKWGIDIAGLFPEGPGKVKFLIVSMDYFTEWIEVKAIETITGGQKANQSLGEGIKARLDEGNKNWIEELSHVLWAHRIMIKSSHGDTPFSLTYGTEALIPTEIKMPTYRTVVVDAVHNNQEIWVNLDLLEERRECAAIREAKAKLKMTKGKLGLKWEGPYKVTEALRDGAYMLRSMNGVVLPWTWNVTNLKKCYI
nr:hypothetical protein [Tanacetum cinerariifolium]